MAKQAVATTEKPSLVVRIQEFIQEVKDELKKVSWPGKEEVKSSTQVVLFMLAALAIIVLAYDIIFSRFIFLCLDLL